MTRVAVHQRDVKSVHAQPRQGAAPLRPAQRLPATRHLAAPTSSSQRRAGRLGVQCAAEPRRTSGKFAELLQGGKEAQDAMEWARATVIENKEASADGTARTLVLSVDDAVVYADGRRVRHVQERRRWGDSFVTPGQLVAVRYRSGGGSLDGAAPDEISVASRLFALACSPYSARSMSSNLDASIVELLASRGADADADEAALAALPPGAQLDVSQVLGRGYCSLFNSAVGLQSALEEGRPLVLVAAGTRGIAPLRAALAWTPVQAHAGTHGVSLFYAAPSPAAAAYLPEWEEWRDAGVKVHVLYTGEGANGGTSNGSAGAGAADSGHEAVQKALEVALFGGERGFVGALGGGDPGEAAVAMCGLPGDVAAHLTRRFTRAGVASERLLFCDYF